MGVEGLDIVSKIRRQGPLAKYRGTNAENGTAGDALVEDYGTAAAAGEQPGSIDNTDGEAITAALSEFNPFNLFRYRRFGKEQNKYDLKLHNDQNLYAGGNVGGLSGLEDRSRSNLFSYIKNAVTEGSDSTYVDTNENKITRNPTAKIIIDTFKGNKDNANDVLGPTPYAFKDFLFCKHYGKIPNNRLVTLRRFTMPVADSLVQEDSERINVPLAQALTYFGEGTDNTLNKILPISWDFKWEELKAEVKNIEGNEVLVDDVLAALGITGDDAQNLIRAGVALKGQDADVAALQIAGQDEKLRDYVKGAYGQDGPYWNKILGPVNVTRKTRKREPGLGEKFFDSPITMDFEYELRSFNFTNPKVAMLDLITNFLTLTYNSAPFWGGGFRYFKKPGVTVSLAGQDLINKGQVLEGILATLNDWHNGTNGALSQIFGQLKAIFQEVKQNKTKAFDNPTFATDESGKLRPGELGRDISNVALAGRAASLMQAPLSYRSILGGEPIGEWHMVVGNPLDPIGVMGDLLCTDCTMTFSDELGADDFPKSIKFTVTLKQGRPRAKQDIESIFNYGGGPLSFSRVKAPNGAQNANGGAGPIPTKFGPPGETDPRDGEVLGSDITTEINTTVVQEKDAFVADNDNVYTKRVSEHYGPKYGKSPMLVDYLAKTRT